MRLIDADAIGVGMYCNTQAELERAIKMIDAIPTAYDVDAVVRELEVELECCANYELGEIAKLKKAIAIVKRGGRNE